MTRPSFLRGIKIGEPERLEYAEHASNWMKLSSHLPRMEENAVRAFMLLEWKGPRRIHVLGRLKSRYNRMRNVREDRELLWDGNGV